MSGNGDPKPGLAWPDPSAGPTPPPEYGDQREVLGTRHRIDLWDRTKVLLILAAAFGFLFWYQLGRNQTLPVRVVFRDSLALHGWVLVLAGIEVVRQVHYLVSEHVAAYHRFWVRTVFGSFNRWWGGLDDWARYRFSRALRLLLWIVVIDLVVAWALDLHPTVALLEAPVIVGRILIEISRLFILFFVLIVQFLGAFWFLSRVGREVYMPEEVKTRFSDVWGQDHVLDKVRENLVFLDDPASIEAKGGHVPGGILLWGPPGTGKTLIAEAVAGETGKPFVYADVGAMNGYFVGMGVLTIKGLFRKLRKLAIRHGGVVVFLDEADALGSRGAVVARRAAADAFWQQPCNGMTYLSEAAVATVFGSVTPDERPPRMIDRIFLAAGGGGGGGGLQALLTELSGLRKPRGFFNKHVRRALGMRPKPPPRFRMLVLMATNMPSALDPALLRPGRIDRQYKVGYPSKAGRIKTYEGYLSRVRHSLALEQIEHLATITPYATGATIKDLVNEALIVSIRAGRQWITWEDMVKARLLKALGPPEDVEYIERERHATAIHEACHALVAYRVRHHATIDVATIEKGQTYLGMVASIPLEEQFTNWRTEYEADLMVGLAGLVGERIFFEGDQSSGVSGDLFNATTLAIKMEGFWGMGSSLGSHMASKAKVAGVVGAAEDGTDRAVLETELGRRVERLLVDAADRTRALIERERTGVLALAHALECTKTLTGDDVTAVLEGRPGPLVDGSVYHVNGFAAVAESYHRRVVEAHKTHGGVAVPLPTATDWMREPVGARHEDPRDDR